LALWFLFHSFKHTYIYLVMKSSFFTSFIGLCLAAQLVTAGPNDDAKAKDEQLKEFTVVDAGMQETTQFGAKINNSDSLKAGLDGPTLMEDFMMREKIMHFGKNIYTHSSC
jgi:hypothetical protein